MRVILMDDDDEIVDEWRGVETWPDETVMLLGHRILSTIGEYEAEKDRVDDRPVCPVCKKRINPGETIRAFQGDLLHRKCFYDSMYQTRTAENDG